VRPYYDHAGIRIFHADCREVLPTLPQDSVDLLLTDPPYKVGWQSGFRSNRLALITGDDGSLDVAEALTLALRVLRNQRHLYVFGRADLSGLPLGPQVELIWDKENLGLGDLSLPWGPAHEPILFAVYVSRTAARARGSGRLAARLRRGSVLRCPRRNAGQLENGRIRHPSEKPVDLLRQLIESSSILGETVLDPFMGCGSTLVAAQVEGRSAIGIEIEEPYCEIAAHRLGQEALVL
jgi:site-specific DNA-methyltransferase (adenine-specific)